MIPIPVTTAHRMAAKEKPSLVKKFKNQEKSYRFSIFELTPSHVLRLSNIEGKAGMYLGEIQNGKGGSMELNATSIDLKKLKGILADNPFVGILQVAKGTKEDGEKRYVAVTSMAFDDETNYMPVVKSMLRSFLAVKPKPDSQKTKLYTWEGKFFNAIMRKDKNWKRTSDVALKSIANKVIAHFQLPKDKIRITNATTKSANRLGITHTYRDDTTAEMPTFVMLHIHDSTIDTLIHELAHLIVGFKLPRGVSSHGAEFCGVYAHILGLFSVFAEADVLESMKKAGLKTKVFKGAKGKVDVITV